MDAKQKINPGKAPNNIWCTLTRPSLHPAALRTLGGDVTRGWGRKNEPVFWRRAGRGHERPLHVHSATTAATLRTVDSRKKKPGMKKTGCPQLCQTRDGSLCQNQARHTTSDNEAEIRFKNVKQEKVDIQFKSM